MSRTHITFLIDRSGSMESQEQGVRDGFASFVKEQQNVAGKCRLTVIQFDLHSPALGPGSINETLIDDVSVGKVDPMIALEKFKPRGSTPLFDATALAIKATDETIAKRTADGKKPDHVIFVVFTDGQENASREWSFETLSKLVADKEKAGWTFTYLGANHDSYAQANAMQFAAANIQSYAGSHVGAQQAYSSLSSAVTRQRTTGVSGQSNTSFFGDDKEAEDALTGQTKPPA